MVLDVAKCNNYFKNKQRLGEQNSNTNLLQCAQLVIVLLLFDFIHVNCMRISNRLEYTLAVYCGDINVKQNYGIQYVL